MRKGFISYSHADREICDALYTHLADVNRQLVRFWRDPEIKPGDQWNRAIAWHIQRTHVALILVSSDAMKVGGFVPDRELPMLRRRVQKHGTRLIPVIVRPYDRQAARAIADVEAVPRKGQPLGRDATPGEIDEWCAAVVTEVRQFVDALPPLNENPESVTEALQKVLAEVDALEAAPLLDEVKPEISSDCQKHLSGIRAAVQAPRADLWYYVNSVTFAWAHFCDEILRDEIANRLRELLIALEAKLAELGYDWPPDLPPARSRRKMNRTANLAALTDVEQKIDAMEIEAYYLGQPGANNLRSMEFDIAAMAAVSRAILSGPKPDVLGASFVTDNAARAATGALQELISVSPGEIGRDRDYNNARRVLAAVATAKEAVRGIAASLEVGVSVALTPGPVFQDAPFAPQMVVVPAGRFIMGADENEIVAATNIRGSEYKVTLNREIPAHEQIISKPFAVGIFPITFDQYDWYISEYQNSVSSKKIAIPGDGGWGRGRRPVINVNWMEARRYCEWLSEKTGRQYRLLSEIEWEYCSRAGASRWAATVSVANNLCWWEGNSEKKTHPVGQKSANAFGIHDMQGNVWEWCDDPWVKDHQRRVGTPHPNFEGVGEKMRSIRGGGWDATLLRLRYSRRSAVGRSHRANDVGFRVARDLL